MRKSLLLIPVLALTLVSCSSALRKKSCSETRAAFDVGSGTTKMKVYKYDTCNKKVIEQPCEGDRQVSYKEELKNSSGIQEKTVNRGIAMLLELKEIAVTCGATQFSGVATSAFRQAKNAEEVVLKLKKETAVNISIISQQEEAILGFNGALSKAKNIGDTKDICVWDIGGSSMQMVCSSKGSKKKVFLGNLAAVPFKNHIIANKKQVSLQKLNTPNPVSSEDYSEGIKKTKSEAKKIQDVLDNSLEVSTVLGIGGVHYYALSKIIGKKEFSANDISDSISRKLDMTDKELGGGKYVDTSISNLILVEGLMRNLKISTVKALKVNLTEGLVSSPKYWK